LGAQTDEHKPILIVRMLRIGDDSRVLIEERRPGFLKGDAMLPLVGAVLPRIPFEADVGHADSVFTT
jgi:hypothetical protein